MKEAKVKPNLDLQCGSNTGRSKGQGEADLPCHYDAWFVFSFSFFFLLSSHESRMQIFKLFNLYAIYRLTLFRLHR